MLSAWVARGSQRKKLSTELRQDGYFYTTLDQLFKIEIHASLIGKKYFLRQQSNDHRSLILSVNLLHRVLH